MDRAVRQGFREFEDLRPATSPLSQPDPELPYYVQTQTSDVGMGAVLYQLDTEDQRKVVSYASAKFDDVQLRYCVHERECLAIVWALKRYKRYLDGQRFTLRTKPQTLA